MNKIKIKEERDKKILSIGAITISIYILISIAIAGTGTNIDSNSGNTAIDTTNAEITIMALPYHENFESGWNCWYADHGVWEVGNSTLVNCHGGSNCAATILNGNYPGYTDSKLISPSIQLPIVGTGEEIHLRFWQWFSYAYGGHGEVKISVYNSSTGLWEEKSLHGQDITDKSPWSFSDRDLTSFAGKKIKIIFSHINGYSYQDAGWYIDDVEIIKNIPLFSGNFESGWDGWSAQNGVWQVGTPTIGPSNCHDGSKCAGTVLDSNYPPYTDSVLISSSIQLPQAKPGDEIHLNFWHWFSYAYGGHGEVKISVYNSSTGLWEDSLKIGNDIVDSSSIWSPADRELTRFAGKKIRIIFNHINGYSYQGAGWYIDDVKIVLPDSITVISPNGGENWPKGTTQTINWAYNGNPGKYVKIDLLKGGILYSTIKPNISIGSNGYGYYNWPISVTQELRKDYKVKITSRTNSLYNDASNGNFAINGCKVSTVYGYKFNDTNNNKTKEPGETGLSNWTIGLNGFDTCTRTLVKRTVKTNSTGYFTFRNINSGTYVLSEEFKSGWLPTTDAAYTLRMPSSSTTIRKDFGNKKFI